MSIRTSSMMVSTEGAGPGGKAAGAIAGEDARTGAAIA